MRLEKARWFNDAECAVVLTIDDLVNGYLDMTGAGLGPQSDWGFGCRRENSIFRYFETWILSRHPEVRYTVFVPFGVPAYGRVDTAYPWRVGSLFENREFMELLTGIVAGGNEIGYHGHAHGRRDPTIDSATWIGEDRDYSPAEYQELVERDLERARRELGIEVRGGRSPGYYSGPSLIAAVTGGLFRWWSFDYTHLRCPLEYRGRALAFPTNVSGGTFQRRTGHALDLWREWRAERGLRRLIEQGAIVTVTEHFLRTRPDGRRQGPNVYDDIASLDRILLELRKADAWYATCSEIAQYQDTYDHTEVRPEADGSYVVEWRGRWPEPLLTLVSDAAELYHVDSNTTLRGAYRRNRWHFNHAPPGRYRPH